MAMLAELIKALAATGATVDQIAAAVEAVEQQQIAQDEARRAAKRAGNAERQKRFKERKKQEQVTNSNADNALPCVTDVTGFSLDKESPQTPKEINPSSSKNPPKGGQKGSISGDQAELAHVWPADAFGRWYEGYPHKVGRGAAETAFEKIRRSGRVPFDALMAGLDAYRRTKPAHVDWCNPATWLNQKRWEDAPASPAAKPEMTEVERRRMMQKHFV